MLTAIKKIKKASHNLLLYHRLTIFKFNLKKISSCSPFCTLISPTLKVIFTHCIKEEKHEWERERRARYEFKYGGKNACTYMYTSSSPLKRIEVWVKRGWMVGCRLTRLSCCVMNVKGFLLFLGVMMIIFFPMRRSLYEYFTSHTFYFLIYFLLRN